MSPVHSTLRPIVALVLAGSVSLAAAQGPPQVPASQAGPVVAASAEVFQAVSQFYGYDTAEPLNAQVSGKRTMRGYTREKVVFTGTQGRRVPGYLALPANATGPVPVVLLIDGVQGSKERWFTDDSWPRGPLVTEGLIAAGIGVFALDAVYHGERAAENDYRTPQFSARPADRDMIVQSIVEQRRGLDYLATRPDVDMTRVGALGLSMGGIMTFALSSMDPRLKAAVAGVTPIRPMKEVIAIPIAPMTFAPQITIPILTMIGREDGFYSVDDARQLLALIRSPVKDLQIYESGHRLPAEYAARAVAWLSTYLK